MPRPKLQLTEEEKQERKERNRAKKREWARNNRAEKSSNAGDRPEQSFSLVLPDDAAPKIETDTNPPLFQIPDKKPTLQSFEGVKMLPIDTVALNEQVKKFKEDFKRRAQGLPVNPESNGLIDKLKNLLPNVRSMLTGAKESVTSSQINLTPEAEERKALINEYITLAEQMPGQDITIPDNVRKSMKDLEKCDIQELRLRLVYARKHIFTNIDSDIAKQVLHIACMGVGKFLNCYDELEKEVKEDKYLQGVTQNLLSTSLLSMISDPLKVAGLFGNHVIKARIQAGTKNQTNEPLKPPVQKNETEVELANLPSPIQSQPPRQETPLFSPPPGLAWRS